LFSSSHLLFYNPIKEKISFNIFSKKSIIISIKLLMLEEDVVVDHDVDESVFGEGGFVIGGGGGELDKV
jgi:hypothetical protein